MAMAMELDVKVIDEAQPSLHPTAARRSQTALVLQSFVLLSVYSLAITAAGEPNRWAVQS